MISRGKTITHEHLLSVIHTEADGWSDRGSVNILDAGCGDGFLLAYLAKNLPLLLPGIAFGMYGFDVHDHGVQYEGFSGGSIEALTKEIPIVDWERRITSISCSDSWPYEDGFFDLIVSNQVIEHVNDHNIFLSEIYRTLKSEGYSIHLFPLKNCIFENHLKLPFVHKINNFDFLRSYVRGFSRLGLGKFRAYNKKSAMLLDEYVERHADYMHYFTNYISYNEILRLAKKCRLRASFKYTRELYLRRVRSALSLAPRFKYQMRQSGFLDFLFVLLARYISIVTLFLQKRETYRER
jgi:SAM-dependent methyltransferase